MLGNVRPGAEGFARRHVEEDRTGWLEIKVPVKDLRHRDFLRATRRVVIDPPVQRVGIASNQRELSLASVRRGISTVTTVRFGARTMIGILRDPMSEV